MIEARIHSCHNIARRGCAGLLFAVLVLALLPGASLHAQRLGPTEFDSVLTRSVSITGNASFSEDEFLTRFRTRPTPGAFPTWLYHTFGARFPLSAEPRYFDAQLFQDDVGIARQFYKNNGFFHATVDGSFDLREDGAHASITIVEGPRSRIDSVAYRRLERLPPDVQAKISASSLLRPGQPYRADDVQAERQRVLAIMADNGFPRGTSDSVLVERKLSNNNVVIKLGFSYGRRLYFGEISEEIRGVDELNLSRQIIYDRLDFEKGEIYSRTRQAEGETNLIRLDVFSSVQITPKFPPITDEADSLVPITLELVPRQRFELAPALVLNNQLRGISTGAEVSFSMRNVFGGAQALTSRVNVLGRLPYFTRTYQATSQLRFVQPYLFSVRNSGYLSGAYSLVAEADLAEGTILQLVLGGQRFFSPRVVGEASVTYEISEFNGDPRVLLGSGLISIDTTETINFRNAIRSVSLERDMTNDFFNPSQGWSIKGIFEEAGLLESAGISPLPQANAAKGIRSTQYTKAETILRYFTDLSAIGTTIFGARLRVGMIHRHGDSKEQNLPVPVNRRYYAGGASSVRGWTARELAVDTLGSSYGGNGLVELSAEIRWDLFPRAKNILNGLWLVVFADAGNLWPEFSRLNLSEMALAFGVGLRYNLPFGPIRADFGMKAFNPSSRENAWFYQRQLWNEVVRKGVFQFGIGHAF